ncbi:MAG: hypothetical protein KAJ07_11810 [Planctomycetes bacterium]|nr:hypothetical protein [Planctomycetota bacterium]
METVVIIIIISVVSLLVGRYYYKALTSKTPGCSGCKKRKSSEQRKADSE